MVKLTRIYTRGGDTGKTSLGSGERVSKSIKRVEAFGTVDEVNSIIGIVRLHTGNNSHIDNMLFRIQNDLFDLGADLCMPKESQEHEKPALRILAKQVERLEQEIDELNSGLPSLSSFILPGGSEAASYLHLARTITRIEERVMVDLSNTESINSNSLKYINRLSDHFFVLARHVNNEDKKEILWVPGDNR